VNSLVMFRHGLMKLVVVFSSCCSIICKLNSSWSLIETVTHRAWQHFDKKRDWRKSALPWWTILSACRCLVKQYSRVLYHLTRNLIVVNTISVRLTESEHIFQGKSKYAKKMKIDRYFFQVQENSNISTLIQRIDKPTPTS